MRGRLNRTVPNTPLIEPSLILPATVPSTHTLENDIVHAVVAHVRSHRDSGKVVIWGYIAHPYEEDTMEQICRVCRSSSLRTVFTHNTARYVCCRRCTHVFLNSEHTADSIKKIYERYGCEKAKTYFQGITPEVLSNIDGYLRSCRQYCMTRSESLRLLDVGCGTGVLLQRARQMGFDAEGIEICETLAREAAAKSACPVHSTVLSDAVFPESSFDIIIMYDLLEHLPDPADDMNRVRAYLKPGGILFILTPNDNALVRRLSRFVYRTSLHRVRRPMNLLYYSDHLSYFTPRSMTTFLHNNNFELVRMETRNQELSRLELSPISRLMVRTVFQIAARFKNLGGKLVVYARKT